MNQKILHMDKKVLHLSVNKQWFKMIADGTKDEEYREIKQYWISRLLNGHYDIPWLSQFGEKVSEDLYWKDYTHVVFTHGYGDDKPHIEKQIVSMSIGKPQKGLCPYQWINKCFFVIKFI